MATVAAETSFDDQQPPRVREVNLGGAIDEAVLIIRRDFGLFVKLVLIAFVPWAALVRFVATRIQPVYEQALITGDFALLQTVLWDILAIWLPLTMVQSLVIQPLTIGVVSFAAARLYVGRAVTLRETFRRVLRHSVSLLVAWFLMNLCVMAGIVMLIVPGILFMLWFLMAPQVIVMEGRGPLDALARSMKLANVNLLVILGLGIVLFAISFGLLGLAGIIPEPYTSSIAGALASGLVLALQSAALTVYYFSCRCRLENYDLELLADRVAAADGGTGPQETPFAGSEAAGEE